MFPPVDDAVVLQNPDFANLYSKLTNVILNPDGTTKEDRAAKERVAVREVGNSWKCSRWLLMVLFRS